MIYCDTESLATCLDLRRQVLNHIPNPALSCVNNFQIIDRANVFYRCCSRPELKFAQDVRTFNTGIEQIKLTIESFLDSVSPNRRDDETDPHGWTFYYDPVNAPIVALLYPGKEDIEEISPWMLTAAHEVGVAALTETSPTPHAVELIQRTLLTLDQAATLARHRVLYKPFFTTVSSVTKIFLSACVVRNKTAFHCLEKAEKELRIKIANIRNACSGF